MFILSTLALAAAGGVVHGTVRADSTLEPIAHAVIELPELGRRVAADERGYYVLADLPAGRWEIRVSALGYATRDFTVQVVEGRTVRLDAALAVRPVELEAIEVTATGGAVAAVAAAGPPPLRIEGPKISIIPGLAEPDVFRALQTLPAVAAISDFSSALYVRGGASDQNLLLLDGAPLFNPFHLGGVFAAFDPSTTATVELLPGAFPAAAGDRLSSVVSVNTRDGGRDRTRGQGAIGLISSRASLDGPFPGGGGSYLLSLRRTYVDLFTDAAYALGLISGTLPYAFTDGHLKLTHDVGAAGTVSASLYVDREGIHIPEDMAEDDGTDAQFGWGSYAAALKYRQPVGGTLLAEFRAAVSAFTGDFDLRQRRLHFDPSGGPTDTTFAQTLGTRTLQRDILMGADLTWHRRHHRIGFGLQLDSYVFDHDIGPEGHELRDYIPAFRRTDRPTTVAAYIEDHWAATESLRLRGGLRVLYAGERGTAWMPRLGARLEIPSGLALSLGAGRYTQVMHSLRVEESAFAGLMAYDLLAAVPPGTGLPLTDDVVLGAEWRAPDTEVRVEAYLKRTRRLPLPPVPADPLDAPIFVIDGWRRSEAHARGIEATVRRRWGTAELSASYALAYAEFEADGEHYPARYERRHTLDLTATLPLGERGLFSTRLAAATGQPYTPVTGTTTFYRFDPATGRFFADGSSGALLLGAHNSARLPGYFRLDVAVRKEYDKDWFGGVTLTPYLQVINVLNTRNVLFADPNQFSYGQGRAVLEYLPQLPILPTFGVEWRF